MGKFSDWDIDLAEGQFSEELVRRLFDGRTKIEVKRDLRWRDTGNLYIETEQFSTYYQKWIPSGLSITKADFWAFQLDSLVLFVQTDKLREAVYEENRAIEMRRTPATRGYLVKVSTVIKKCYTKA